MLPIFLKEVNNGEASIETDEVGELDNEQEGSVEDLLPQEQLEKYHEYFQNHARIAPYTQLADNKFCVLDDKIRKIMQTIKEAHTTKTAAARRALFACPNTYLSKEMGEEFSDEFAETFIPDEHYISQRIDHIGEWLPKAQAFVPSPHSPWIPQDLAGIRLDNELVFFKLEKIPVAVEKMQQALQAQQKMVKIDGQEMKATQENIDLLKQASVNYEESASNFQRVKRDALQDTPNRRLVPIIKDNLEESCYYDEGVVSMMSPHFIVQLRD